MIMPLSEPILLQNRRRRHSALGCGTPLKVRNHIRRGAVQLLTDVSTNRVKIN
jgi:hypothetical protein